MLSFRRRLPSVDAASADDDRLLIALVNEARGPDEVRSVLRRARPRVKVRRRPR